jgi:RNA polymerase sigma-70 factor, ECF subfamily
MVAVVHDLGCILAIGFGPPIAARNEELDRSLIDRAQKGDRRAFDDLFRHHADEVHRRLTRLVGPDPEREDLVQEVFIAVFRNIGRFRGESTFSTWLYKVVVNAAYGHLRRRKRRPMDLELAIESERLIEPGASPESKAEQREQLIRAFTYLDRLKPKKRVAFVLRVVEGLSVQEIAPIVDATPAAVSQRVRHAQLELDRMIQKEAQRHGKEARS